MNHLTLFIYVILFSTSCNSHIANDEYTKVDTLIRLPIYTVATFKSVAVNEHNFTTSKNLTVYISNDSIKILSTGYGDGYFKVINKVTADTVLSILTTTVFDEQLERAIKKYDPVNRLHGEDIRTRYAFEYKLLNKAVPQFSIHSITNKLLTNDSLKGKITVINFWYYGCPPCMMEIKELNLLKKKYSDRNDLAFYAFFKDSAYVKGNKYYYSAKVGTGKTENKFFSTNFNFTQFVNAEKDSVSKTFDVTGYPETFIIDKSGIIRYIYPAYYEGIGSSIANSIEFLTNEVK